jgi:hypothetical protein
MKRGSQNGGCGVWRGARVLCCCALAIAAAALARPAAGQYFHYDTTLDITNVTPMETSLVDNGTDDVKLTTDLGTLIEIFGFDSDSILPDHLDSTGVGTDIVFGVLDVNVSNATPFETLTFDFEFHIDLTDYPTNSGGVFDGMGTFDVTGTLTGTIGAGFKVNLNSITVDPIPSQAIGGDIYTLTFQTQHFTPPGPIFPGAIGVHVSSVPVPEPATLTLMGLGALALSAPALRRLRRRSRRTSAG